MKDVFDTKVNVEITLGELEELIIMLRVANKALTGEIRSELEEKLSDLSMELKTSIR